MSNPSPGSREKTGLLVVVALLGIGVLVATAWIVLKSVGGPTASKPMERAPQISSPASPAAPAATIDTSAAPTDLATRIRAEIERASRPVRVTLPILGPDGEPAADAKVASDPPLAQITGLTAEIASLLVEAPGAAAVQRERVVLTGADVTLPPVRLSKGAILRGRVVTPDGAPVEQAVLELFEAGRDLLPFEAPARGGRGPLGRVQSDARGEFRFEHVAVRHASLLATPPAARRGDLASSFLADAVIGAPVTLTLDRRAAGDEIAGIVVDSKGAPVRDFSVIATLPSGEAVAIDAQPRGGPAAESTAGAFALRHMAAGYCVLTVEAEGFARTVLPRVHTGVGGLRVVMRRLAAARATLLGGPEGLDVPVTWRALAPSGALRRPVGAPKVAWMRDGQLAIEGVAAGSLALELSIPGAMPIVTPIVDFVLDAATELGTFSLESGATLAVSVRDPEGKPLPALVALASPHHTSLALARDPFTLPDHRERLCGTDGRLEWLALPPGERAVAFRHEGLADRTLKVVIPAEGVATLPPVVLARSGAIEGRLQTPTGSPLGAIEIAARRVAASDAPPTPGRNATTDLEGRFELRDLDPGRWELTILARDEAVPAELGVALEPPPNRTKVVDVPAGAPTRCDFTLSD